MADCESTIRELETYLDDELLPAERGQVDSHLEGCSDCQQAFEFHHDLRQTIREKLQNATVPSSLISRLEQCLQEDLDGDGQIG